MISSCAFVLLGCSAAISHPYIAVQPVNTVAYLLQPATFKVTAWGGLLSYQWQKNGADIPGATGPVYTTPNLSMADNGAQFRVVVTNIKGTESSDSATLTVAPGNDAATYHYDNMRTGQNLNEKVLTKALVNYQTFGLLGSFMVDGLVDAQPLYLSNVSFPNSGAKNVLYVATEHDSVFAFDADAVSGHAATYLWKTSIVPPGEVPDYDHGCTAVSPEIGITSTPVIDRSRGAIYVVGATRDSDGNHHQRLHALALTTGQELFGGPVSISATYPGTGADSVNGTVPFEAGHYLERAALLEVNGTIYLAWGSHCDIGAYTSWVMAYSADTLQQTNVLNLVPNGSDGGMWMSGGGPAADAKGNIFITVGNGTFDTDLDANGFPSKHDCGNCFVKLSSTAPMTLLDFFTPSLTVSESASDHDFGSGGPMLLPDVYDENGKIHHLAVSGSKGSSLYVIDRDNMGKFNPKGDSIYQEFTGVFPEGVYSKAAYFNGAVYFCGPGDNVKAFRVINGQLSPALKAISWNKFFYPGATPSISANISSEGIVWAIDNGSATGFTATLYAYDADNLDELYDSNQAPKSRDSFNHNKFITPLVIDGKVYVGAPGSVAVFGLLP
jgi:hypothetical protein